MQFPNLFAPLEIGPVTLKNRILFSGHHTNLAREAPGDEIAAYYERRARGGAGLIVVEIASIMERGGRYSSAVIMATSEACIPGYRKVAEACHAHGTKVFAQLFHPGRAIRQSVDGYKPLTYAPSATAIERFRTVPCVMTTEMIGEVVDSFANGAAYLEAAGIDGVEIVVGFGYLLSQFLSEKLNQRTDGYGGSFDNRMRILREIIAAIRGRTSNMVLGMRITDDEMDAEGLTLDDAVEISRALDRDRLLDYVSVTMGSTHSIGAAAQMVPDMRVPFAAAAPHAAAVKAAVGVPVFVSGRINQPHIAEQVIGSGQADVCAMTRALISDPDMPTKAAEGRIDDIRACVGCNQSCIGRVHLGVGISCLQHPESGRELVYGTLRPAPSPKRVLVVGGGPAGMKAASVAARRGHHVTLCEARPQLGGQIQLAQRLPHREEFGTVTTNLAHEMVTAGVDVRLSTRVTAASVTKAGADVVILATGARSHIPAFEGSDSAHVVDAWRVLSDEANVGGRVVVYDWRADWIGIGVAETLAQNGCRVTLAVNGTTAAETLPAYVRDPAIGALHALGVEVLPYSRLFGVDENTVYLQHTASGRPVLLEDIDTLVVSWAHEADRTLADALDGTVPHLVQIGDCLTPRTCEEAILEGLEVGAEI